MSRYDVEKFEPPPDPELVCCICTFVLDKPMESPCQHVFCKHCIETWLGQRRTCPTCRKKVSKRDLKPVLPLVQNMLNKLTMVCDFHENGCQEKPTLELYQSHITKCDFELLTCRYVKCQTQVLRRDIIKHESELCEFREVLCLQQCGLHIPVRDMDSHDCMLSLKKHAEERQKHAEELEARLQQLMSLQQSLREDVETLRRQVEQERQRRPSQDGWSSSSWDSWDDDEQNTTGFFESDSEPPADNSQLSTDSNDSPDHASRGNATDSDIESGRNRRNWQRSRPLSISSSNSDDLEIVEETLVLNADNAIAANAAAADRQVSEVIEFVNEGEDSIEPVGRDHVENDVQSQSGEGGSGNQILSALDVVRDFVDSVFTQNQIVRDLVDSHFSQNPNVPSVQQLLQQISDCRLAFSGVTDLNLSASTWESVCRFLTDIVSSLLKLRTNQNSCYVTSSPQSLSSAPALTEFSDTSHSIQNNFLMGLPPPIVTYSETLNSNIPELSGDNSTIESLSSTDSGRNSSLVAQHAEIPSKVSESSTEVEGADILPLTSDVTGVLTMSSSASSHCFHSHTLEDNVASPFLKDLESVCNYPKSLSRQAGSDYMLDLLSTEQDGDILSANTGLKDGGNWDQNSHVKNICLVMPLRTESKAETSDQSDRVEQPCDDACIFISSTGVLGDGNNSGVTDVNRRDVSTNENVKTRGGISSSYPEVSPRHIPFQTSSVRQETVKRCHSSSGRNLMSSAEPPSKMRKKLGVTKDTVKEIKGGFLTSFKHENGDSVARVNIKDGRSRPVSWTATSALDTVPVYSPIRLESDSNGSSRLNSHTKEENQKEQQTPVTETESNKLIQQETIPLSGQRRRHRGEETETTEEQSEFSDVQIPPRTAQLLLEYSDDSDTSWEPGNSDVELSDDMSISDDVETDSSYEVQVPKPLYQIIEEMAAEDEDSDDSWTPS